MTALSHLKLKVDLAKHASALGESLFQRFANLGHVGGRGQ